MNSCKRPIIHERSSIITIYPTSPTHKKPEDKPEYSLKQNCFDPSKSSPPNEFMVKLNLRMKLHGYRINDNNLIVA
jgi:hypothetical protein